MTKMAYALYYNNEARSWPITKDPGHDDPQRFADELAADDKNRGFEVRVCTSDGVGQLDCFPEGLAGNVGLQPVPANLGKAFAAIVNEVRSWDQDRLAEVQHLFDQAVLDEGDYRNAVERVDGALTDAGINETSCGIADDDLPPSAGPWLDELVNHTGAHYIAAAVLARDLGLVTGDDWRTIITWWVTAGLPVPAPGPTPFPPADEDKIAENAEKIANGRYQPGWPTSVVIDPRPAANRA